MRGVSLPERFGVNLRKARLAARLSQEELGFECGLDRTEVGMLERGEREPKLGTLVKLTGGLGIDPVQLYAGMAWNPGDSRLSVTPVPLPRGRVRRPRGHRPSR
jgi:transcriptional regulator with XRE-family HTH domain